MTVVPIVNGTSVAVSDMFEEYIGKIIYEQKRSDKKKRSVSNSWAITESFVHFGTQVRAACCYAPKHN